MSEKKTDQLEQRDCVEVTSIDTSPKSGSTKSVQEVSRDPKGALTSVQEVPRDPKESLTCLQEGKCKTYKQENLHVDLFLDYIPQEYGLDLLIYLDKNVEWNRKSENKRSNANYGDVGVSYTLELGGGKEGTRSGYKKVALSRVCHPWSKLPVLKQLCDMVSKSTGCKVNYVRIQRYPNRKVGISPHRDKELSLESCIIGLNLGDTRMLTFSPTSYVDDAAVKVELPGCSLYNIRPPTNIYYTHCIETEEEIGGLRISLTFCYSPVTQDTSFKA